MPYSFIETQQAEKILAHAMEHCQSRSFALAGDKSANHAYTDAYWTIRRKHDYVKRELARHMQMGVYA